MSSLCRSTAKFLIAIMSSFCIAALAEQNNDAEAYNKLCSYDTYCSKLKNRDGTYVKPKEGLMKVMQSLGDPIREISKSMSVDPRAVAGAILAENSLNVQVDDDTHSFLETIKLNPIANDISKFLRGKSFSIGFGQIKPESALESEPILAKTESRPPRTPDEVKKALLNPVESVKYAAAIIRQCQDEYQKNGFDVSKDPAVLATLYNLGNCQSKALEAKKKNRPPRPNFFGFFITHFKDEIARSTGLGDDSSPKAQIFAVNANVSLSTRLRDQVPLVSHPPKCDSDGSGEAGEWNKLASLKRSASVVSGQGEYKVLSPGLDCDLKDWSLIQTNHGEIGWIANDALDLNTESFVKGGPTNGASCDSRVAGACKEKLEKALGREFLGYDAAGLLEIRLTGGPKDPEHPNFKTFDPENCFSSPRPASSGMTNNESSMTAKQAQDLMVRLNAKKPEIIKALGIKSWDDPKNFYKSTYSSVEGNVSSNCKIACRGGFQKLEKLISTDPKNYAGYSGFKAYQGEYSGIYLSPDQSAGSTASVKVDNKAVWSTKLQEIGNSCHPIFAFGAKSRVAFEVITETVNKRSAEDLPTLDPADIYGTPDVAAICRGLVAIKNARAKGASAGVSLDKDQCAGCSVQMTYPTQGGYTSSNLDFATVANYVNDDSDFDDVLSGAFGPLGQKVGIFSGDGDRPCTYDPIKTAQRIEALSGDPCVESVFAPDHYLLNRFGGRPGGAYYKPFAEDDRFAIKLKDGCSRIKSADASEPRGTTKAAK